MSWRSMGINRPAEARHPGDLACGCADDAQVGGDPRAYEADGYLCDTHTVAFRHGRRSAKRLCGTFHGKPVQVPVRAGALGRMPEDEFEAMRLLQTGSGACELAGLRKSPHAPGGGKGRHPAAALAL
ncbi:MAG: hypothetical protein ACLRZH_13170 [Ruthenibacterium lactatiformans]